MNALHAIADLCCVIDAAQNETALRETLRTASDVFGMQFFMFRIRSGRRIDPAVDLRLTNYPKRWVRLYDDSNGASYDPVVEKAAEFGGPFRWDGLHQSAKQQHLLRQGAACGMCFGFTTSDRSYDGAESILSFCGRLSVAADEREWRLISAAMMVLTSTLQRRAAKLLEDRHPQVADRFTKAELKCLTLMAGGSTMDEAARRLGVRPRTVRYYLECSADKLGVMTGKEAVLKALNIGLVETRAFGQTITQCYELAG